MRNNVIKVRDAVALLLAEDESTRSKDNVLVQKVYDLMGYSCYIPYDAPSIESITRARRKIQEKGHFLPDDNVVDKRRQAENEMREINTWYPQ